VRILKERHGWLFVQSKDNYLGWAQPGIITRIDSSRLAAYNAERKLIVTSIFSTLRSKPGNQGATISDAVMADLLLPIGRMGSSFMVRLPDGRIAYVPASDVEYQDNYIAKNKPTAEGVEKIAMKMVGFPYLWGGTSTKGVDCSGFTKTVFRMNDIRLPRDASQQVYVGKRVAPGPNFENLRKGDLLFFGTKAENGRPAKIVHVAIYLGGGYFIQSANRVQINSLLKSDTAFDAFELNRFVMARRILPSN
jgi:cell wall-associated NlpC family hydrolase